MHPVRRKKSGHAKTKNRWTTTKTGKKKVKLTIVFDDEGEAAVSRSVSEPGRKNDGWCFFFFLFFWFWALGFYILLGRKVGLVMF